MTSPPLSADPPLEPPVPIPAEPITFSIWHLFVFTAAVAGVFALLRVIDGPLGPDLRFSDKPIIEATWRLLHGLILGGVAIGCIERVRGRVYFTEPGHFLLLLASLHFADLAILHGVFTNLVTSFAPSQLYSAISCGASGGIALWACFCAAPRWIWKLLFLAWAGNEWFAMWIQWLFVFESESIQFWFPHYWWWTEIWRYAFGGGLFLCAVADLCRRPWADWLHWLGLALVLALYGLYLLPS